MNLFELIGAIGLVLIIIGVMVKSREKQYLLFMGGGILLGTYSVYIQNLIFIILQIVFILSAFYEYLVLKKNSY